ncbi:MAG: hypothetical protein CMK52_03235 [Proteobacteria bacterium]|nr:hypothetical protein [Pseudomonadota bacterium]MAF81904.1 hypothetical protein [Pseudomonadota bacterium]|tara:strand:- start:113 stop:1165 length:1053 start_codon:yes stop_codon:yes gene_type:complete
MKHPKPKPFVEKELRLSGKFSFEMVKDTNNLYTPLKKKIVTQYFDDNNYNLLKNGIALRKRSERNSIWLELKIDRGQGKSLEWVSDITKNDLQGFVKYNFQDLPSEEMLKERKLIRQSLPFQKIVKQSSKIFQTDILRAIWIIKYKESSFRICFDQGKIVCQTLEHLINEIEIEVHQDEENRLLEFYEILWAKLPNSFYQGRSKALRGFELRENQRPTFWKLKKLKTISAYSFQQIKNDLLRTITLLDYISSLFCENDGKSPANCFRSQLLEIKTFLLFVFGASSIFDKEHLRVIIRNIHRMEKNISLIQKKRNLGHTVNVSQLYKSHTNLLLSLHSFAETLNKFSGLNR